jgi:hypothetical protein
MALYRYIHESLKENIMKYRMGIALAALVIAATGAVHAQSRSSAFNSANEERNAPVIAYTLPGGEQFVSRDGGRTWAAQGTAAVSWLTAVNSDNRPARIVYDLGNGEAYASRDGGLRWTSTTGAPLPVVAPQTPSPLPQSRPAPDVKPNATPEVKAPEVTAEILSLSQNPTSGITDVTYRISQEFHVDLGVYDQSGNLVIPVAEGVRPAGDQVVTLDASMLKPGIYYCRLSVSGITSIAKLIIAR